MPTSLLIENMDVSKMMEVTNDKATQWAWKLGGNTAAAMGFYHLLKQCPFMPDVVAQWISMTILTLPAAQQFIAFMMDRVKGSQGLLNSKLLKGARAARRLYNTQTLFSPFGLDLANADLKDPWKLIGNL
jgi:hypothetical protein